MDIGETIGQAIVREVREETGYEVEPEHVVGIYSDPGHVFAYDDGEVRQQFSVCFACRIAGGQPAVGNESSEVAFFDPSELADLDLQSRSASACDTTWSTGRSPSSRSGQESLPWRAALRSAPWQPRDAASPDAVPEQSRPLRTVPRPP